MIAHENIGGHKRSHPVPYHGDKTRIPHGILRDIVRKFDLPEDFLATDRR